MAELLEKILSVLAKYRIRIAYERVYKNGTHGDWNIDLIVKEKNRNE